MLRTTLEQWRMFHAVVEAGGFNQAAERIHKSQSTIHHAVQKLEALLGLALFEPDGRRVRLTEAGELMHRRTAYVLEEASKVEALAGVLSQGVETELAVAVDHAFPDEQLYAAIDRVAAEYPHLCVQIRETVLSGANELLDERRVKLAVSPYPMPQCLHRELTQVTFVAVAAADHALLDQDTLGFEDLKAHRQIVTRDSGRTAVRDEGWLEAEQRWTVDHLRTSVDLVLRGLGFAWLPEELVAAAIEAGQLARLPLEEGGERHVTFYLNVVDDDGLGPAARKLAGELHDLCRSAFDAIE